MCGIVGIVGFSRDIAVNESLLETMCQVIRHRGPDDQGIYVNGHVGLGMRRLSIIDLNTGHQPISNEDGSIWVILNGEIYNYLQLRRNLEKNGHQFVTQSDTEVIVHLYEEYGRDCVKHLRGMFAAAVWSEQDQELLLMRDRIGQKPLFYTIQDSYLLFASEIKSILEHPEVSRTVNLQAFDEYLTYGYVPCPATMFEGIYKLPPAHRLICRNSSITTEPYWTVEYCQKNSQKAEAEYVEETTHLLREAVELRMISDVPLGAFLSGGLDSSMIVGLMSQISSLPVKTFAIGFGEKTYDELEYARIVADHFQTEHYEFQVTPKAQEIIEDLVWHFDEPFADSSAIPTFYVSKCAREHVTVALSGDGGDEIFAGYRRYLGRKLAEGFNRLPKGLRYSILNKWIAKLPEGTGYTGKSFIKKLKRFVEQAADVEQYPYSSRLAVVSDELKRELYSRNMIEQTEVCTPFGSLKAYFDQCAAQDAITQMLWVDLMTYLPDDILVKVDKMSMAVSLETRAPFLDHKLIEYLAGVPTSLKLRGWNPKYLLKKAGERFLPPQILQRQKQGFVVPIASWLKYEMREYIRDILLGETARNRGYMNPEQVERVLDAHQQGTLDYSQQLWAFLMFELWCRKFLDF